MPKDSDTELTDLQREILRLKRIRREINLSLDYEIADLERVNKPICKHPLLESYRWEHDNGYGVQKWLVGEMCSICRARRPFPGQGSWIAAEDFG